MSVELNSANKQCVPSTVQKPSARARFPAYSEPLTGKSLSVVDEMFKSEQYPRMSNTELEAFVREGAEELLDSEQRFLCSPFSPGSIMHSPSLVSLYTGLPNASQFYYVVSFLEAKILDKYSEWYHSEQIGFHTHSCLTFMKLRLNMTDIELAERFEIEPYLVNMTLRLWIPALYSVIYRNCENVGMLPVMPVEENYTKAFDFVEICKESYPNTKKDRGRRKALIAVRIDGFITFASRTFTIYKPDANCIEESSLTDMVADDDLLQCHPEHRQAAASMRILTEPITDSGEMLIEDAAKRLQAYRILMAIPTEYSDLTDFILPVCVSFANFWS